MELKFSKLGDILHEVPPVTPKGTVCLLPDMKHPFKVWVVRAITELINVEIQGIHLLKMNKNKVDIIIFAYLSLICHLLAVR